MLSLSTPEYVVRKTVSAISSAIEKMAFLKSSKPTGSDIKADSLGEGQLAAVVYRVGRAAHVRLPRVGACFAAATGFLLAAERATDLGAARSDVHVDDAAVAAGRRHEAFGLADVVGEDARGKPLRHGVVPCDYVVEFAVRHGVEDGREG